jgi:DDE superfamily endonuclease
VRERREQRPGRKVEVWAFDEHRLGLKPVLRRQWAPKGQRPIAVGHPRYEWLYLYGFVHPATGGVVWFICSTVDATLLGAVLTAFAEEVGAGEDKLIVLVLDNAGWHVSGDLVVPPGIELAPALLHARAAAGRAPLAAGGRGGREQALRHAQGPRRGAGRALPHARRHAGGDQGRDRLRLVAARYSGQPARELINRIRY